MEGPDDLETMVMRNDMEEQAPWAGLKRFRHDDAQLTLKEK
jgi:hypothetical protein